MKKVLFVLSACVLALAVFFAGTATWRLYEEHISHLSLTLTGNREIYLEYGQDYIEPGVTSMFASEDANVEVPVQIYGQVDTDHLGTYLLKYSAQMEGLISTDYRRIYVVDTQKPVIILNGEPDAYILPGQTYAEEGFRATDNYDGDITDKVIRKEADGIITYTVADSSGNTFTTQRTINYLNPGLPDIQLIGSEIYLLAQGDTFTDPGVTATDKLDGDVSASVMVEGVLDTATPGLYTLRYTAVNSYGYSSSTQRTVYVLPMEYLLKETETPPSTPTAPSDPAEPTYPENCIIPQGGMAYAPTGKVIYLTYDDGPSQHTETLLDVLAKYQVKVSFFVVQSSKIDLIARAAQEGHTVAIHTYTHNYSKIYASDAAFLADLQKMQEVIAAAKADGDSVGGIIECMITGLPAGLGDPMFDGVENRIAQIVYGIPAVKGLEFGSGFSGSYMRGSENNDAYAIENGKVKTLSNHSGGILGGITTGMPVVFQAAIKPTPSIAQTQKSISLTKMEEQPLSIHGRHDPCIVPRAVPVIEAAAAIAIFDICLSDGVFREELLWN